MNDKGKNKRPAIDMVAVKTWWKMEGTIVNIIMLHDYHRKWYKYWHCYHCYCCNEPLHYCLLVYIDIYKRKNISWQYQETKKRLNSNAGFCFPKTSPRPSGHRPQGPWDLPRLWRGNGPKRRGNPPPGPLEAVKWAVIKTHDHDVPCDTGWVYRDDPGWDPYDSLLIIFT